MAHSHTNTMLTKFGFADKDRQNSRHDAACNYLARGEGVLVKVIEGVLGPGHSVSQVTSDLEKIIQKGEGKYATTVGFIDVAVRFTVSKNVSVQDSIKYPVYPTVERFVEKLRLEHEIFSKFVRPEHHGHYLEPPDSMKPPGVIGEWKREWMDKYSKWSWECERAVRGEAEDAVKVQAEEVAAAWRKVQMVPATVSMRFSCIVEVKIGSVTSGDLIRQLKLYSEYHQPRPSGGGFKDPPSWPKVRDNHYSEYIKTQTYALFEQQRQREIVKDELADLGSHCDGHMISVVDYDVDSEYVAALKSARISVVRLGSGFERYLSDLATAPISSSVTEI